MWGCNYFSYFPWMNGLFHTLLWGAILLGLVYLATRFFGDKNKSRTEKKSDREDSLKILKVRFAKGSIDEEEYDRMKEILTNTK